jgi:uncharacterized protein (TIGR03435 family)
MHWQCTCTPGLAVLVVATATSAAFGQASAAPGAKAQPPAETKAAAPAFDVAAIRQNLSDHTARTHIISSPFDGHFTAINATLKLLIRFAYGLPESRIVGGPGWLDSTKFDVEAKADEALDAHLKGMDGDAARLEKQKMLQALLADRFKLVAHMETRELPVYGLVVAKGGAKFLESKAEGTTIDGGRGKIDVRGGNNSVALLAEELAKQLDRVVIDQTGIQGRYNLSLRWAPDDGGSSMPGGSATADAGPSIFTAIQEQLGLKLESQKGPVQVLVIDKVEMPSEN